MEVTRMSERAKEGPALSGTVQEVQGWFPGNDSLQAAIAKLALERYDRSDFSLPEDQGRARPSASAQDDGTEVPETPIDHQQFRTMGTGMASYAGAVIAAGVVVATGGAAALAAGLAAAAGLGAAAVSEGIGKAAYQSRVDEYDRHGAAGTLVLAVHATTQAQADEVVRIMRESGASQTKLITHAGEALTAGISASSWTGTA